MRKANQPGTPTSLTELDAAHAPGGGVGQPAVGLDGAGRIVFTIADTGSGIEPAEIPGVFGRFEWGDVEFFLLDDRYHRSPNLSPDGPDKVMFGTPQLKWLMDGLRSSEATFKIVVGGNQMMKLLAAPLARFVLQRLCGFLRRPTHVQQITQFKPTRTIGVILQRALAEDEFVKPAVLVSEHRHCLL